LGIVYVSWKRWKLPLLIVSVPLVAISLVSVIGVFLMAPAALWFGCALWLWSSGKRLSVVLTAIASILLIYLAASGVSASTHLYYTPI
jgi:hypothetical protein